MIVVMNIGLLLLCVVLLFFILCGINMLRNKEKERKKEWERRKKNWNNLIKDREGGEEKEEKIVLRNWYRDPWGFSKEKKELNKK